MWIVEINFKGDNNSTTEFIRSTTEEWAKIKYNRALRRWWEIIVKWNYQFAVTFFTLNDIEPISDEIRDDINQSRLNYIEHVLLFKNRENYPNITYFFEIKLYEIEMDV